MTFAVLKFSLTCQGFKYKVTFKESLKEARESALSFFMRYPLRYLWEFGDEVYFYRIDDVYDIFTYNLDEYVCRALKITSDELENMQVIEGVYAYNYDSDNIYVAIILKAGD